MRTPILSSTAMRDADHHAIHDLGFPGMVLMENAARGAFDVLQEIVGNVSGKSIAVLCGGGNNGGDGLALARHALIAGATVTCASLSSGKLSTDARAQMEMLASFGSSNVVEWETFRRRKVSYDIVVDAMLGTGATGALRSPYDQAVRWANRTTGVKLALDIPTGIDADSGIVEGEYFQADATATMAALKPGLLLNEGAIASGDISIVHIGTSPTLYESSSLALLDAECAASGLGPMQPGWNKYDRGKVLIAAGSQGMTGAAVMTATAALRSGAGLVVLALPEGVTGTLPQHLPPEIMTLFLPEGDTGAFSNTACDVIEHIEGYKTIAVGPGLSKSATAARFAQTIVQQAKHRVVLDADGLNAFADTPDALSNHTCELVLTPHHGEMARLTGKNKGEIASDPVGIARQAAEQFNAVVVLKGAPTVVATPDGQAWINAAGNPGMATGGTGDVLTGIITALAARTDDLYNAVLTSVYLHSDAGDRAARDRTEHSIAATDIITYLPEAFQALLDIIT